MERRRGTRATKVCHRCKRRKPFSAFYERIGYLDGLDVWCRTCRRNYIRRWVLRHRDECNAKHRLYYQQHRDRMRKYNREYQRRRRALMRAGKWKARR